MVETHTAPIGQESLGEMQMQSAVPEDEKAKAADWWDTHAADSFMHRHLGSDLEAVQRMLGVCGFASLDALADTAVPPSIRLQRPLQLPPARSEAEALAELRKIAARNQIFRSYLGMGYHDCIVPPVVQRNILENPGWYTQYTPYQAEISQGRLEALLNFQTMICDLTGLDVANASLLDEATAAAEAMMMCHRLRGETSRNSFFVSTGCHPQTIEVVRTRAQALGIDIVTGEHLNLTPGPEVFGVLLQYPATDGTISDFHDLIAKTHEAGGLAVVAADLLSLTLLKSPGEFGADIAVGSAQRFGVPLGYGGPHAAFFATRDAFKRHTPGRLVGVSKDSRGRPALRLALQTREQHIRREKATSNICTAQVLLAIMAAMYAVYHGPNGLKRIATRIHGLANTLAAGLAKLGYAKMASPFFDTLRVETGPRTAKEIIKTSEAHRINLRPLNEHAVCVALDETTSAEDVQELWQIFNGDRRTDFTVSAVAGEIAAEVEPAFRRTSGFLEHPVFHRYHCETEMQRYLRRLESRDLSLTASMIPLGSCTMKLNAAAEMLPVSWPEFSKMHPFAPVAQAKGYQVLFRQLEQWLGEITGLEHVSLQPNAGSQGEYTGLLAIRSWHTSRDQGQRRICLIPQSAHGTNPASATMAGLKVVVVACDAQGNIDVADLRAKAKAHGPELAALMVTYPSTHGVFEESIKEICQVIHDEDGQVYMDGANLNAQVGLCRPGDIGADVCHLNLHKTFCIPHGGGGPGVGPICVAKHLAPFLPTHPVVTVGGPKALGTVSAAPWGSAGILAISWVYVTLMGPAGLTEATKLAILNANYLARRLEPFYPVLYRGHGNLVAHECILDLRQFKSVTVEDVAKRLMDYGFHAPTISWPVPGTMMVEPTESESMAELDRFCEAMIAIHAEITTIESGQTDKQQNLLKNAPHTADMVASDIWEHPYSREQAAYPVPGLHDFKFWPAVGRIDNVFGDRNPVCTCAGLEAYQD